MLQPQGRGLSLADWLVLCLISEGPTHGFAIAGLLTPDGSLGQVWHVHKTEVYRAAHRLEHLGLITVSGKQPSKLGADLAQLRARPLFRGPGGRPPARGEQAELSTAPR